MFRYTVHHCWSWVISAAVEGLGKGAEKLSRWSLLPSVTDEELQLSKSLPKPYSLFRLEVESGSRGVWCTSRVFESLDAKDSLAMNLPQGVMPATQLLTWDVDEGEMISVVEPFIDQHGGRVLLKAALGSGGNGIYFVDSARDVLLVIRGHASEALSREGFLGALREQYDGRVPLWSLQALLQPVLVGGRRSQVRVYVVFVESLSECFYYQDAEVRLPLWQEEHPEAAVAAAEMDVYERRVCGESSAIPYNRGREKKETERLLLSECRELDGADGALRECMSQALSALYPLILQKKIDEQVVVVPGRERVAVLGADLIVSANKDGKLEAKLLEINNNPAMAQPDKHKMSAAYRQHLQTFARDLLLLGLSGGRDLGGFIRIPAHECNS